MALLETLINSRLAPANIHVNGEQPCDVTIHHPRFPFYARVILKGSLGLGEAYMDGWWDCDDIPEFICRILQSGANQNFANLPKKALRLVHKVMNKQSVVRSRRVAKQHYDIGNDLYQKMLDTRMVYTCGYWRDATTLDKAQEAKLELVCAKLDLRPDMRVLDIGCGFGSFAKYAAEQYGVSVVGVTISEKQLALGKQLCGKLPVDLRLMDYRDPSLPNAFPEGFDRIVSLGMFEHVGLKNYPVYMDTVRKLLKKDGLFLLHTIGGNGADPWIDKYIFPGGWLPNKVELMRAIEGKFELEDWHNFGPDYDKTLRAWERNFENGWDELRATGKYDERFRRMWRYYLLSCAGAFRARKTNLWQLVLSPNGVPGGYHSVR